MRTAAVTNIRDRLRAPYRVQPDDVATEIALMARAGHRGAQRALSIVARGRTVSSLIEELALREQGARDAADAIIDALAND